MLRIDHGHKLLDLDGRPHLAHEVSVKAGDTRPPGPGYVLVRTYTTRAAGVLALYRRSFPVHPEPKELTR